MDYWDSLTEKEIMEYYDKKEYNIFMREFLRANCMKLDGTRYIGAKYNNGNHILFSLITRPQTITQVPWEQGGEYEYSGNILRW